MLRIKNSFPYIVVFLFSYGLMSCTSEKFPVDKDTGHNTPNELVVTVHHLYNKQALKDSLLPLAKVDLFQNKNDLLRSDVYRTATTNKAGTVSFITQFESTYYYVKATRPGYGTFTDSIDFPANALVSYLDLILY